MTLPFAKPEPPEAESGPANDNHCREPADAPRLDLLCDHEDVADIARRAERLGNAVVIAMALCLIAAPAIYVALIHAL